MKSMHGSRCASWRLDRLHTHLPLINTTWPTVCCPSPFVAPGWLPGRLGRFYLYFASHWGREIRLAHADAVAGPWHVLRAPALHLSAVPHCVGHVSSPDVHVDHSALLIYMYFHCHARHHGSAQWTYQAISRDGRMFHSVNSTPVIPTFYFRRFEVNGHVHAVAKLGNMGGVLYEWDDEGRSFHRLPGILQGMRHATVLVYKGRVIIFFSSMYDTPEHLKWAELWPYGFNASWLPMSVSSFALSVTAAEGAGVPIRQSVPGPSHQFEFALRDPAVLVDQDRLVLFYAIAGERAIAAGALRCQHVAKTFAASAIASTGSLQMVLHSSTCTFIRRSRRVPPPECGERASSSPTMASRPLLITAAGRSGTMYMARMAQSFGFQLAHDNPPLLRDGAVSWPQLFNDRGGLCKLPYWTWRRLSVARRPKIRTYAPDQFEHLVHLTRDPILAIHSRFNDANLAAFFELSDCQTVIDHRPLRNRSQEWALRETLHHYVLWNSFASIVADASLRVEDGMSNSTVALLSRLVKRPATANLSSMDTNSFRVHSHHTRKRGALSWKMLARVDVNATVMAQMLALRLGYTISPSDLHPSLRRSQRHRLQQHCALAHDHRFACWLERSGS